MVSSQETVALSSTIIGGEISQYSQWSVVEPSTIPLVKNRCLKIKCQFDPGVYFFFFFFPH